MSTAGRGLLIAFEGIDRSGKSTQAALLARAFEAQSQATEHMRFPDRETPVGAVLDAYLSRATSLEPRVAHLLFAANRWERSRDLHAALQRGTHVIVDRYAFSGVAYAAAQLGAAPELLDMCKHGDAGLPAPDVVFYMDVPVEVAHAREDFGAERFEDAAFLTCVQRNYARLRDATWEHLDAAASEAAVHSAVMCKIAALQQAAPIVAPLRRLWERASESGRGF